jgi:hypothetical protein
MKIIKTFERFNDVDLLMPEFEKYLPKNIHNSMLMQMILIF